MNPGRFVCEECGWRGLQSEALRAGNPFDPTDHLTGCPKCAAVNSMRTTCDEPGCWAPDTIGTPGPDAYRRTCAIHEPKK
jgi:hypothetical protein